MAIPLSYNVRNLRLRKSLTIMTALGIALHKISSPIILGILFYLVFAPFGWVLRRMGKDFLRLRPAPESGIQ